MDAIKFEIRENCYSKQGMYAGVDIFRRNGQKVG